nr:MAG TPA: hypothetical protein [Caudoviricetes sp.]
MLNSYFYFYNQLIIKYLDTLHMVLFNNSIIV